MDEGVDGGMDERPNWHDELHTELKIVYAQPHIMALIASKCPFI